MDKNRKLTLREKVNNAPNEPGCYFWKKNINGKFEILYVGKAKNIKKRLLSYFRDDSKDLRLYQLISQTTDIEWIITQTVNDALLLEANIVKTEQPKYNVRLKDDKRYPYLCITKSEIYPQIFITRKIKKDGNLYFGPFSDVKATRASLNLIHKIFPIRKTRQTLPQKTKRRPCMNFYIKRCLAPCQNNVDTSEYNKIINEVILFLEGKNEILENQLQLSMKMYSEKQEFEKALIYRDLIQSIKHIHENQSVQNFLMKDEDLITLARKNDQAQIVLFEIRSGRLLNRKSFPMQASNIILDEEIISGFLRDYYLSSMQVVSTIYTPYLNESIVILQNTLTQKHNRKIFFKNLKRNKNQSIQSLYKMANINAEYLLSNRLLEERSKQQKLSLMVLTKMLSLKKIPKKMECFDISHFQGHQTVASCVVFVNGIADKKSYRHFKITSNNINENKDDLSTINDPQAMSEVIYRRLKRNLDNKEVFADLYLIDGGAGQVNAAYKKAQELGLSNLFFVGLAKKKEELYFPFENKPTYFDPNNSGMLLLRQMRNEAHRFALRLHRIRRKNKILKKNPKKINTMQ